MAVFSVTERGLYKRCRTRWDFSSMNRQGLQPIIETPALTLGLLIHKALEQWFAHPNVKLEDIFKANAMLAIQNIRDSYKSSTGLDITVTDIADVSEALAIGMSMAANYEAYYKHPVPEGYELIAPEQRLILRVPGSVNKLEARLDALLRRIKDGAIFVMEHKTFSAHPNINTLANSDQMLAYTWAASQALQTPVQGVLYNGLWKRAMPPKKASIDDLFMRLEIERPEYEVKNFTKQLAAELDEMARNPVIYPNRRWEGCWDCKGFNALCEAKSKNPAKFSLLLKHSFKQRDPDEEIEWILDNAE